MISAKAEPKRTAVPTRLPKSGCSFHQKGNDRISATTSGADAPTVIQYQLRPVTTLTLHRWLIRAGDEQPAHVARAANGAVETVEIQLQLVAGLAIDAGHTGRNRHDGLTFCDEVGDVGIHLLLPPARTAIHPF